MPNTMFGARHVPLGHRAAHRRAEGLRAPVPPVLVASRNVRIMMAVGIVRGAGDTRGGVGSRGSRRWVGGGGSPLSRARSRHSLDLLVGCILQYCFRGG